VHEEVHQANPDYQSGIRNGLAPVSAVSTNPCQQKIRMNPAVAISPVSTTSGSLTETVRAWYCLRVMARREHIAALNLTQRTGVSVFSPRIRVAKNSPGGVSALATEALFPGYIFARFCYPHDARHVASTPGVLGLVSFGSTPPVIADGVIEQLSQEVRKEADAPVAPVFEEGALVRIVAGCFQGSEGRVLQVSATTTRISILLNLLGQEIQISMPGDQVIGTNISGGNVPAGLRAVSHPVGNRS
jgi:transcriptional antiterminator RfaH